MAKHVPVLYDDVLRLLRPKTGRRYIDGTLGAGGHAAGILQLSAPDGRLLAIDRDPTAIAYARKQLKAYVDRVTFVHASYEVVGELAQQYGFSEADGILLDLGLSSLQLEDEKRGFSFLRQGPLDMRFDTTKGRTAADLVNNLSVEALADVFWRYGEEPSSRRYARAIVAARPVKTTGQLAELIARAAPPRARRRRTHPATRIFQALRIAVNEELAALEAGLEGAVRTLRPGGRVAVISFHSLEDRLVKNMFRDLTKDCICPEGQIVCTCDARPLLRLVSRRAVKPSAEEVNRNPRSRSARLRVAEKLEVPAD